MAQRKWVSWNVRGLGGAEKRQEVRDALRKINPEVVLLQETKLGPHRLKVIETFAQNLNMNFDVIPANGSAGGLLSLWKPSVLTVENVIKVERFLGLRVRFSTGNCYGLIGNIYGPNSEEERTPFFMSLSEIMDNMGDGFCILGGDFNAVLNQGERSGNLEGVDASFCNFVGDHNLIDLPLQNSKFTWYSSRENGTWSRIDR